ncbi:IPT/TIG domain-containing protein [Tenacibaculum sp. S7007]|uniref:IPT/TIG domain-containing protein n=1 Tax=Tenacibaculum pelagium TaxID=2759527 RepID=A0A839AQH6_9FLAO|nr:IPT/TIG domain-containing protein [Tenacibaculum pelagium]MBA6157335.1 IPT/TIG domain-containing protein [Tenacibaculum pelagium]
MKKKKPLLILLLTFIMFSCGNDEDIIGELKRPSITKITPDLVEAGSEITITGKDLDDDPVFIFNGEILETSKVTNSNVTIRIPEKASSGALEIEFEESQYKHQHYLKVLDTNWSIINDAAYYFQMEFISNRVGFAKHGEPDNYVIVKTTDGGNTWSTIEISFPISDFEAVSSNVFYIKTTNGAIKKTVDIGVTWQDVGAFDVSNLIEEMFFKNELEGFLLARKSGKTNIIKTIDGGNTWRVNKVLDVSTSYIKLIQHKNDTIKLFNEKANSIISTTDGGNTWKEENLGVEITYNPIFHFVSENNIWLNMLPRVGNDGGLFNKNSSNNWGKIEIQEPTSYEKIINIAFSNELKGHLLTEEGGSLYTANGGKTWELFYLGEPGEITTVTFFNNTLYVVKRGKLLKKEIN